MKIIVLLLIASLANAFVPSSFTTSYEQKAKKKLGKGYNVAVGTFEYLYPGNLRVTQSSPDEFIYVSNKTKTWIYRAPFDEDEKPEVMIHKGQESSLSNFFDILKSGLKSNKNYNVKTVKNKSILKFKKLGSNKTGLKKAVLNFYKKKTFVNLKTISIFYKDGREIILKLSKTKTKMKFKKKHFVFKVPKNANVTYQ